jgi:hypothetical protein
MQDNDNNRPFGTYLLWIVLASLAPVCWIVGSVTMSLYERDWMSATLLVVTSTALVAGILVSGALAREVRRAIGDLTVEAGMLGGGRAVARLSLAIGELQAVADGLHAAAARAAGPSAEAPSPRAEARRAA